MEERYQPKAIEEKWQRIWEAEQAFKVSEDAAKAKYYVLEMFPYPSGRIHMGHVRNYSIGDVIARQRRMAGWRVLHPMGWDAFGLPAENAAIEHGVHPARWTADNIDHMRRQLRRLGFSYDWERELATCDPRYYRWEQLFFLRMLERGLAYKRRSLVNWCAHCETVLANEQVVDGRCWRCDGPVVDRELEQWFFRITAYAEELLRDLDRLSGWPERVLTMQRNWIGRSPGAEIRFPLDGRTGDMAVFTTRADTLFGVTFMSLAAEHPLVPELVAGTPAAGEVAAFAARVRATSRAERAVGKEGVATGAFCRHPVTGARLPIYVANFVLMEYGTGAVMAVPAHDQRDFEFARAYRLPVRVVVQPEGERLDPATLEAAWEGPGRLVDSGEFTGLDSEVAKEHIAAALAAGGQGGPTVSYRLRDWGISRQRYWGAPIPIVYCARCGPVPVPERDLPVVLPEDVALTGTGGSPLAAHAAFVRAACPRCGGAARRQPDPMDTLVERYGADTARLFCLFQAPPEKDLDWSDQGVEGMHRFLHRLWRLVHALAPRLAAPGTPLPAPLSADDRELHRRTHETIRRVSDDVVERLHFNTAVAAVMELVNALGDASGQTSPAVLREAIDATLLLLAPFVPHIASELWEAAGHARALDAERWPAADPGALARELIELPVQVNGKLRGRVTLPADAGEAQTVAAALADPHIQAHVAGRPVRKVVFVPGRMLNLIV